MNIITKNKIKSSFKEFIDNKIYLKEISSKIWKNYLYVKNDNYSKFMNLNDLEYFLQKKQDGIFNDIMNSIPFLKSDKKTRFITLTLNSPLIHKFEKIKNNDEKLKDIKNQYNIINDFKKSVFKKRRDRKNKLENIDTITKNELTKRKVVL